MCRYRPYAAEALVRPHLVARDGWPAVIAATNEDEGAIEVRFSAKAILVFTGMVIVGCSSAEKKTGSENQTTAAVPAQPSAASPVEAEKASVAKAKKAPAVSCAKGSSVRTLDLKATAENGCEVLYSRDGKKSSVAQSAHGTQHCQKIMSNIKENLEKSGYKCDR